VGLCSWNRSYLHQEWSNLLLGEETPPSAPSREHSPASAFFGALRQGIGAYFLYSFDKGKGGHEPPRWFRVLVKETGNPTVTFRREGPLQTLPSYEGVVAVNSVTGFAEPLSLSLVTRRRIPVPLGATD